MAHSNAICSRGPIIILIMNAELRLIHEDVWNIQVRKLCHPTRFQTSSVRICGRNDRGTLYALTICMRMARN